MKQITKMVSLTGGLLALSMALCYYFSLEGHPMIEATKPLSDTVRIIVNNIPNETYPVQAGGKQISAGYFAYGAYLNDDGELILLPKRGASCDTVEVIAKRDVFIFKVPINAGGLGLYYPMKRGNTYRLDFSVDGRMCYSKEDEHQAINRLYQRLHDSVQFEGFYSTFRFKVPFMMPIKVGDAWSRADAPPFPEPYLNQAQKEIDYVHSYLDELIAQKTSIEIIEFIKEYAYAQETILAHYAPTLKRYTPAPPTFKNGFIPIYLETLQVETLQASQTSLSLVEQADVATYAQALGRAGVSTQYLRYSLSNLLALVSIQAPRSTFETNAKQYLELYPSSTLVESLKGRDSRLSTEYKSSEVSLVDLSGKETTLSAVLTELQGHAVVVDLWGTWCEPCIVDIKKNSSKRSADKRRGVKYVFLSFQDQRHLWEQRSRDLGLDAEEYSFYVLNSDADWFRKQKVTSLPMKLFYEKGGELKRVQVGLSLK